jgi:hypothetical protein
VVFSQKLVYVFLAVEDNMVLLDVIKVSFVPPVLNGSGGYPENFGYFVCGVQFAFLRLYLRAAF